MCSCPGLPQTPPQSFAGHTKSTHSAASSPSLLVSFWLNKAHIVTVDKHEMGLHNLFNFGYSIGCAIGAVLTPTILVGRLSRNLKGFNLPISTGAHSPVVTSTPRSKSLALGHAPHPKRSQQWYHRSQHHYQQQTPAFSDSSLPQSVRPSTEPLPNSHLSLTIRVPV